MFGILSVLVTFCYSGMSQDGYLYKMYCIFSLMENLPDFRQLIEAVLFVSGKPVSLKDLALSLDTTAGEVKELITELQEEYHAMGSAVEIVETVDKKFVMQLKPEFSEIVMNYAPESGESKATLKTLSLIAYKQPVLQSDVVKYRGTGAYKHIKELEEEGLIERAPKERTYLIKTTPKFAEFYGLKSDSVSDIKKFVEEHLELKKLEELPDSAEPVKPVEPAEPVDQEKTLDSEIERDSNSR